MPNKILWILILVIAAFGLVIQPTPNQIVHSQGRGGPLTTEVIAQRNALEKELQSVAIVERKLMVTMRDGKRMAADVYRPKDQSKKYPAIFVLHYGLRIHARIFSTRRIHRGSPLQESSY